MRPLRQQADGSWRPATPLRAQGAQAWPPRWFKAWFAFCALVALAALGGIGWLVFAAISWLERR